jgi:hypothetical protein
MGKAYAKTDVEIREDFGAGDWPGEGQDSVRM